ncbi:MAG TPA: serine protease [Casimicrobiaceae bacterium]|nr:serine protease [Casimicrobiaceae bacterium]
MTLCVGPARRARLGVASARIVASLLVTVLASVVVSADVPDTIARVKPSVVGVGTFEPTRAPPFQFRGTGFAVGDGSIIVTNSHVLPVTLDAARNESIAIVVPGSGSSAAKVREVTRLAVDPGSDLALLKLPGQPLQPLKLKDSSAVREGQEILITGYPIGAVLGMVPATHRGMVSAITPIAIPQAHANDLNEAVLRRLSTGSFSVFQLDATAYPGNSGSPIYDPATGEVLGVVNMVFVKGTKESALSQPSGITYAVPAQHLEALLKSAR